MQLFTGKIWNYCLLNEFTEDDYIKFHHDEIKGWADSCKDED